MIAISTTTTIVTVVIIVVTIIGISIVVINGAGFFSMRILFLLLSTMHVVHGF